MNAAPLERGLARSRARRELPPPPERARLRKAAGLTLQEVADSLGVARVSVWRWEHGQRQVDVRYLADYARVLDRIRDELEAVDA